MTHAFLSGGQARYSELLSDCHRAMLWIDRTEPIIGPVPGPPSHPSDEEQWHLAARVSAFGSETTLAAYAEFRDAVVDFHAAAGLYRQMRDRERDTIDHRKGMDTARTSARKRLRSLENAVRTELTRLQD